jgi:hypothetical protein
MKNVGTVTNPLDIPRKKDESQVTLDVKFYGI